jgi:hypothetical protein
VKGLLIAESPEDVCDEENENKDVCSFGWSLRVLDVLNDLIEAVRADVREDAIRERPTELLEQVPAESVGKRTPKSRFPAGERRVRAFSLVFIQTG